jgi:hypothetical protein
MVAVFFLSMMACVQAATQVPVFRLLQYEYEGVVYGSQVSAFNFLGVHFSNTEDLAKKLVVVHSSELTVDLFTSFIEQRAAGVLVILPPQDSLHLQSQEFFKRWLEVEQHLGTQSLPFPVYFAWEGEDVLKVYEELRLKQNESDQLQLAVSTDEKYPLRKLTLENLHGFVFEYSENLPTFAIVAHYDSFSAVPELTKGIEANGSGVVALLTLAKLFKELGAQLAPEYNLLLLLTSGSALGFQGSTSWLQAEGQLEQVINRISYALCLDSIGSSESVAMHISRFHKDGEAEVTRFYSALNSTAELLETPLEYVKKKVNIADPYIPWEHENFSRRKVVSGTLSSLHEARTSIFQHSSMFDLESDSQTLFKNIQFIAESLFRFLYNKEDSQRLLRPGLLNYEYMHGLTQAFANYTRYPTHLTPKSPFNQYLISELKKVATEVTTKPFTLENYALFPSKPETLSAYHVKPAILDFYIFLAILGYIGLLCGIVKASAGVSLFKSDKKTR